MMKSSGLARVARGNERRRAGGYLSKPHPGKPQSDDLIGPPGRPVRPARRWPRSPMHALVQAMCGLGRVSRPAGALGAFKRMPRDRSGPAGMTLTKTSSSRRASLHTLFSALAPLRAAPDPSRGLTSLLPTPNPSRQATAQGLPYLRARRVGCCGCCETLPAHSPVALRTRAPASA